MLFTLCAILFALACSLPVRAWDEQFVLSQHQDSSEKRVAVIGAGIGGTIAAFRLHELN